MNYYLSKKSKLLKDFDKTANLMEGCLVKRYGEELAKKLHRETREEYEKIIPEIPHIKDAKARALNLFLLIVAQELAVYRIMKKHGKTLAEAWEICHESITLRMEKFSRIKRWFLGKLMYSNFLMKRVKRRDERGEHLKFGDFEVRYLIGDGKEFDWGVDYVACGNLNFLKAQGAEEFAPYACMSDIALGDALGWGLIRTQTIADGYYTCDFRFKKGSKTMISSKTPEVQATIEKILKS
ncbi:MAG: L-2-amino-thiazoline-4-carboxylic acid hydrolase [Planctomycetota bacterium]|jgi:hypothetical protein